MIDTISAFNIIYFANIFFFIQNTETALRLGIYIKHTFTIYNSILNLGKDQQQKQKIKP